MKKIISTFVRENKILRTIVPADSACYNDVVVC